MQKFGLGFLTTQAWGDKGNTLFGAKSFIFGTVVTSFGALLLATPISIAIALFLSELAPRWIRAVVGAARRAAGRDSERRARPLGDPRARPLHHRTRSGRRSTARSAGYPIFSTEPTVGSSMFAAILILTIMIIPIVSSICRELFLGVPAELKDGALALGATRWEVVRGVVFPYARAGIAAALILGLGRALGEAIAVTQVIGNRVAINRSLFEPGDTLASRIAGQYQGADTALQVASLVYLAVILLVFSLIANLAAQLIVRRVAGRHQV